MTAPDPNGSNFGRYLRAIVGTILILFDLYLIWAEHIKLVPPKPFDRDDLIMHGILMVAGVMMIDKDALVELLGAVKDYVPFLKKNGT